jgi:hypothetical protein
MKNITIMLISLLSFNIHGQTTEEIPLNEKILTAPIGLSFGMSPAQVKVVMAKKKSIPDLKLSKKDRLIFNKVKVGPKTTNFIMMLFVDGKLFDVMMFYDELEANLQERFDVLKETLDNKYGSGEYYRNFESPYHDGDGYEMQAIRLGKGSISSYWTFKNATISLEITESLDIKLVYEDEKLAKNFFDRKKAKEESDF